MALPKLITRDHQEEGLQRACLYCTQPDAGLLGPGSISWQLVRENLLTLAQGRVMLLTLANSRLSQLMVSEHDAIQRLHHTQVFLLKLIFGNLDQTLLTLQSQRERQRTLLDVSDGPTLLYMLSAWMDSMLLLYQEVVGPLTTAHQERFFEETMLLAEVLGLPACSLPLTWHDHQSWWQQQLDSCSGLPVARHRLGRLLIREQGYPARRPYGEYLPLAPFQLPEHLRHAFGLPPTGLDRHRQYQQTLNRLMEVTRRLPPRLRYQPVYHEALQRLDGRPRADLATRLLNRWWTGQANLVNSGWSLPREARLLNA